MTDRSGQEHDIAEALAAVREVLDTLTLLEETDELPEDLRAFGGLALLAEPAFIALLRVDAAALHYDRVARSRRAQGMPWYVYHGVSARLRQALS